jgi:hypothetical protein
MLSPLPPEFPLPVELLLPLPPLLPAACIPLDKAVLDGAPIVKEPDAIVSEYAPVAMVCGIHNANGVLAVRLPTVTTDAVVGTNAWTSKPPGKLPVHA